MIKDLINYLRDKKILILGYGREGKSSYNFIRKHLEDKELYISDLNENFVDEILKKDLNTKCIAGKGYLDNLEQYDLIIKTPGISFAGMNISAFKNKITSQLELLLEFFENKVIGITGTKGKSTTSTLTYQIIKDQGKDVLLLGNIGTPVFEHIDEINEETILVLEMSSHQLEYMDKSPNIAILTNLFPEHLDHYNSYEEYAMAKFNIFKNQKENDFFLYDWDSENLKEQGIEKYFLEQNVLTISLNSEADIYLKGNDIYFKDKKIYSKQDKRNLIGDHGLKNIMFALGVAEILNLDLEKAKETVANFKALPHRLELVGQVDGVYYYDNSIATIPEATMEAVKSLGNVDTLIIGGMDRGIDLSNFIEYLKNCDVPHIICMPTTGHTIAKKANSDKFIMVDTLEEAVNKAKKITAKGKSCLLAPAAASYDYFKNFEEKGDCFKKLVLN